MSKAEENLESNKKSGLNRLFRRFASASMFGLATVTSGQSKTLSDNFNDKEEVRNEYSFTINSTSNDDSTYNFEEAPSFDEDKYMTNITVRNDTVSMVHGAYAYYSPNRGDIIIHKGDANFADMGFNNTSQDKAEELLLIHERQHEIDIEEKGVGTEKLSLAESFQREYHIEVAPLIAEKLEIRRQFKEAKTEEEKKKFFEKFSSDKENKEYVSALKIRRFNPDNQTSQEFLKEMEFIKNSSINYRCDPNDNAYYRNIVKNVSVYLMNGDVDVNSNPSGFEKEIRAIYQIGGFDFCSVGNQDLYVMKDKGFEAVDKMLVSGADVNKVDRFIDKSNEIFVISIDSFNWAESFDVSGLSREQAETVLQTAIVAKESADNIAESICLGNEDKYDFKTFAGIEQTALYLDMKRDIWEKNGTLSEAGDEEKFNRLMAEAKNVEIDCEGWLKSVENVLIIAKDPSRGEEFKAVKRRVKENQGKVVNVDDYFSSLELPLKGKSVEEVLDDMKREEEENRKFAEEYYKNQPPQEKVIHKQRLSEPYQVKVFDLQSSVLADELKSILEKENKVENLKDNTQVEMTSIEQAEIGDREQLRADLKEQKGEICDNAKARSQNMKINLRIAERSQGNFSKTNENNLVEQRTDTNVNQIAMQAIGKLISR